MFTWCSYNQEENVIVTSVLKLFMFYWQVLKLSFRNIELFLVRLSVKSLC
jgi:hypothetical protein